ncbi:uncharacterized protein [Physcomitrium patens]|nr:transcriptional-regulating factor 1-like isoform X2 [Physcomitrium patens]XP_024364197.1 transcriptional-regulating factor 1-like isoform X2 [Physcomitrium patens]|eukprot:XP_024364196.1 transcriptional-regulating factor 1-like isoform X2 [Physcomitrella patens]
MVDGCGKEKMDSIKRVWQSQPANSCNHAPSYDLNVRPDIDDVDTATLAAVERTVKKYADNLLRVLEGMSGRLTQLEVNSLRVEHSVDKIKVDAANNFGATDGKLMSLENMIREVQRSVQVIRDKQEITEEQMKLEKLQLSAQRQKSPPVTSMPKVGAVEAPLALPPPTSAMKPLEVPCAQAAPVFQQQQSQQLQPSAHQLPQPSQQLQAPSPVPQIQMSGMGPPLQHPQLQMRGPTLHPQHQQLHPQGQVVMSQHQQIPAQGQIPPVPQQHMQMQVMPPPPPQQHLQVQSPQASQLLPQSPQVQPSQHPPHLQQHQQLQLQVPTKNQPDPQYPTQQVLPVAPQHSSHASPHYVQQQQLQQGQTGPAPPVAQHYGSLNQDVNPYGTSQGSYSQALPPQPVPGGYELRFLPLPTPSSSMGQVPPQLPTSQHQQHGQSGNQMYESRRHGGGTPPSPGPYQPQAYPSQDRDGPQGYNQYAPPQYRMAQPGSPASGGYPQLPTARSIQPSSLSTGGTAPVAANRVSIDEVIDKVASMGFGRDQVRAIVRKLMENGTTVDLNVVLDKLMNGDSSGGNEGQQPAKGWYGR